MDLILNAHERLALNLYVSWMQAEFLLAIGISHGASNPVLDELTDETVNAKAQFNKVEQEISARVRRSSKPEKGPEQ